jgi:hypothetical protein
MEIIPNYGVYFIYCKNSWKEIFNEQLNDIFKSNILSKIESLFLSVNYYEDTDLKYIKNKIEKFPKIKIANTYNKNFFEFEALRVIKKICSQKKCNIFYMHTKGAGISEENKTFYHNSNDLNHLRLCVRDWRKFMESHLLYNADIIIEKLKEYDACGVNLESEPKNHFSGNFWWSKSSFINKLPDIDIINKNFRWSAEFWIGEETGKFLNLETNKKAGYIHRL